jgi:hypothetical protein
MDRFKRDSHRIQFNIFCLYLAPNNDYTNLPFSELLKEYSTAGIFLKEKFVIKIKMSDESSLGSNSFTSRV